MRAGKLDRIIEIQRRSEGEPDAAGASNPSFASLGTLRAQIIQANTTEYLTAAGETGRSAVIFRTRFLDGITTGDRVIHDGRPHDVKEIKELGRRQGMELRTEAAEG